MNGYTNGGSYSTGSYSNGHGDPSVDNEDSDNDDNDDDDSSSSSGSSDDGCDDTDAVVAGESLAADNAVSALGCLCEYMANWSSAMAASGESHFLLILYFLNSDFPGAF